MKKIISLFLVVTMLCCLVACTTTEKPNATNNESINSTDDETLDGAIPNEVPGDGAPMVGSSSEIQYGFLWKRDGEYKPISVINLNEVEEDQFTLCYGYMDDNGEVVQLTASFEVYNNLNDDTVEGITIDPPNTPTDICQVTIENFNCNSACVFCRSSEAGTAALPVIPQVLGRGPGFLKKNDDGSYSPINYITADKGIATMTLSFGWIDNGTLKLYDSKYWAKAIDDDPNGFLTVAPTGMSTTDCIVVTNTEKPTNGAYVYCEPDCAPGIVQAALPIVVNN